MNLIVFNKPFKVLCQFSKDKHYPDRKTLADYIPDKKFYPAGRLDFDSEGLLLLTNDGKLQQQIADPKFKLEKTYWVQVEGQPDKHALSALREGIQLKDGLTRPARASTIETPEVWPREPPVTPHRDAKSSWLKLSIREGKNRQVRRMCAAVGHPVLRLIRAQIGQWRLDDLTCGQFHRRNVHLPKPKLLKPRLPKPK